MGAQSDSKMRSVTRWRSKTKIASEECYSFKNCFLILQIRIDSNLLNLNFRQQNKNELKDCRLF